MKDGDERGRWSNFSSTDKYSASLLSQTSQEGEPTTEDVHAFMAHAPVAAPRGFTPTSSYCFNSKHVGYNKCL